MNKGRLWGIVALFLFVSVPSSRAVEVFTADMEVRLPGATSYARIYAKPGFLRMNLKGGRTASGMIAHYAEGRAWALIPATSEYREFPLTSLRDRVPHFFDPALKPKKKKKIGREQVEGQTADKYIVTLAKPGGRTYDGYLWEALAPQGYPLRWEDSRGQVVAIFHNPKLVERPEDFFQLPKKYSEQVPPSKALIQQKHCQSRRNPAPSPSSSETVAAPGETP